MISTLPPPSSLIYLRTIQLAFQANKMAVNTSKTKFIVFRTRGKVISPEECVLQFNNNEPGQPADPALVSQIDRIHNEGEESSFKLLGIFFDEYLSFNTHITHLCSKISKSLFCINRIKNFINGESLKGSLTRDFRLQVFFINQCPLGP